MGKKPYVKPAIITIRPLRTKDASGEPVSEIPDPPDGWSSWNDLAKQLKSDAFEALSIPPEYLGENPGSLHITIPLPSRPNMNHDTFPAYAMDIPPDVTHVNKPRVPDGPDEGQSGRIPGESLGHVWITNEHGQYESLCGVVETIVLADCECEVCDICTEMAQDDVVYR